MAGDHRQALGREGEDAACRELERRGYTILARWYRTRRGEIDIIARDLGVFVFVEVKTRAHDGYGGGAAAVTRSKQRRLAHVALAFLARAGAVDAASRFDVVVVTPGLEPRIEVYADAFSVN